MRIPAVADAPPPWHRNGDEGVPFEARASDTTMSDDDASLQRRQYRHRVDFMYTFGAPSTSSPHVSNPENKCSE